MTNHVLKTLMILIWLYSIYDIYRLQNIWISSDAVAVKYKKLSNKINAFYSEQRRLRRNMYKDMQNRNYYLEQLAAIDTMLERTWKQALPLYNEIRKRERTWF